MALGYLMAGPDVGAGGVDPQAEQAARGDPGLRGPDMGMRGRAVAVLEDLDADHQRVGSGSGQGGEVTVDQAVTAVRGAAASWAMAAAEISRPVRSRPPATSGR